MKKLSGQLLGRRVLAVACACDSFTSMSTLPFFFMGTLHLDEETGLRVVGVDPAPENLLESASMVSDVPLTESCLARERVAPKLVMENASPINLIVGELVDGEVD